jgi:hypothetical protein
MSLSLPPSKGFLITVPMREEWETETGIEVLDGWSFQVNAVENFSISNSSVAPVLLGVSLHASVRFLDGLSRRRFHVYFKSKEMQGTKSRSLENDSDDSSQTWTTTSEIYIQQ